MFVPVVSKTGKPLMPCHPARARCLLASGVAVKRFDRGLFYLQLTEREDGSTQDIAMGIDPGSKKEGFSVKSKSHTYLNIQADAVTWVKDHVETRRNMRHTRRYRKTPYRECRSNRSVLNRIPPSTKARWGWKLRICKWLARRYPITTYVVEDIQATTFKGRRWNLSFSPLQVGKDWFYREIEKLSRLKTYSGWETKDFRDRLGLKKSYDKMSDRFEAHCIDSWVLANAWVGGHSEPDFKGIMYLVPLRFHRRQLHRLQPKTDGVRKPYGGTMSFGWKRGTWIKHPTYGVAYVGGNLKGRISLHSLQTGERLTQSAKPEDLVRLTTASWRVRKAELPKVREKQVA